MAGKRRYRCLEDIIEPGRYVAMNTAFILPEGYNYFTTFSDLSPTCSKASILNSTGLAEDLQPITV